MELVCIYKVFTLGNAHFASSFAVFQMLMWLMCCSQEMMCSQSYRICLKSVCVRFCFALQITRILKVVGRHTVWCSVWLMNNASGGNCAASTSLHSRLDSCYSPAHHKQIGSASIISCASKETTDICGILFISSNLWSKIILQY